MGIFVKATEHDVDMCKKLEVLSSYVFLYLNTPIFDV
jgi:hypothetical protein